ncbi:hypothetical protein Ddc_10535 [Ditylenchus destructor]|nr:hypothetical protein Ddc_10535 [Ditylenchus destructor]
MYRHRQYTKFAEMLDQKEPLPRYLAAIGSDDANLFVFHGFNDSSYDVLLPSTVWRYNLLTSTWTNLAIIDWPEEEQKLFCRGGISPRAITRETCSFYSSEKSPPMFFFLYNNSARKFANFLKYDEAKNCFKYEDPECILDMTDESYSTFSQTDMQIHIMDSERFIGFQDANTCVGGMGRRFDYSNGSMFRIYELAFQSDIGKWKWTCLTEKNYSESSGRLREYMELVHCDIAQSCIFAKKVYIIGSGYLQRFKRNKNVVGTAQHILVSFDLETCQFSYAGIDPDMEHGFPPCHDQQTPFFFKDSLYIMNGTANTTMVEVLFVNYASCFGTGHMSLNCMPVAKDANSSKKTTTNPTSNGIVSFYEAKREFWRLDLVRRQWQKLNLPKTFEHAAGSASAVCTSVRFLFHNPTTILVSTVFKRSTFVRNH